jgi:hypothetical protein
MSSESRDANARTWVTERSCRRCQFQLPNSPWVIPDWGTKPKLTCPLCRGTLVLSPTTPPASEQPSDTRSASE